MRNASNPSWAGLPDRPPGRIVVRAPNWLGDLMMATGTLRAILDRWPDAAVDLIVRAGHESLPLPHRGRIFPFDAGKTSAGAFGAALAGSAYGRFYVLPPSFSSAWMAFRSGIRERVGYRDQFRGLLLRPALDTGRSTAPFTRRASTSTGRPGARARELSSPA
jgi:heptosyltransferase-2